MPPTRCASERDECGAGKLGSGAARVFCSAPRARTLDTSTNRHRVCIFGHWPRHSPISNIVRFPKPLLANLWRINRASGYFKERHIQPLGEWVSSILLKLWSGISRFVPARTGRDPASESVYPDNFGGASGLEPDFHQPQTAAMINLRTVQKKTPQTRGLRGYRAGRNLCRDALTAGGYSVAMIRFTSAAKSEADVE